jgi:hypothetical protein
MKNRFTIVTGHYGSGKTVYSVNLALHTAAKGNKVTVVDLDVVNPYFRTADYAALFREKGVSILTPKYANSNLDVPSLNFGLQNSENTHFILDTGGDDAGAFALGRYADIFETAKIEMHYVVNKYRYLTQTAADAAEFLREIELAGGVKCTGIVNNSNLGTETTEEIIRSAIPFGEETAKLTGVPIAAAIGVSDGGENLILTKQLYGHCFTKVTVKGCGSRKICFNYYKN